MVPVADLQAHPKNRNKHPKDQIDRLAKILDYQGWRYPVKVSKQSGFVTAGHGRIEAAKVNGWAEVPVNFQDYENEEMEYADVQADNAIASWAELDLSGINTDLAELGPDLDIDLLGIKEFSMDPPIPEEQLPALPDGDRPELRQVTFTLHFEQVEQMERALAVAKGMGAFVETRNDNSNGNALARVCETFLGNYGDR